MSYNTQITFCQHNSSGEGICARLRGRIFNVYVMLQAWAGTPGLGLWSEDMMAGDDVICPWHGSRFSRYVLAWEVSISLESAFCVAALDWALTTTRPEIFNTDQGAQFTSEVFTNRLEQRDITISMDGRGRAIDNIFIERLWRTVKYEEVYLKDYVDVLEAVSNLKSYFTFYNHERPHQSPTLQKSSRAALDARAA